MQHIEVDHGQSANKYCVYCKIHFRSFEGYQIHMSNKHGLSVWPASTAASSKEEIIDDLIFDHVHLEKIKMQLSVEVSIMKHISGEEEEPDKIMQYLNTDMVRVDYGALERGQFLEMIDHMLNTINCFASHGSGWLVEKISKVTTNFASYVSLPNDPKKQNFSLVNIETKNNNKFFLLLYCSITFEKWKCSLQSIRRIPKQNKNSYIWKEKRWRGQRRGQRARSGGKQNENRRD